MSDMRRRRVYALLETNLRLDRSTVSFHRFVVWRPAQTPNGEQVVGPFRYPLTIRRPFAILPSDLAGGYRMHFHQLKPRAFITLIARAAAPSPLAARAHAAAS